MDYGYHKKGNKFYPYIVGIGELGVWFYSALIALQYGEQKLQEWES